MLFVRPFPDIADLNTPSEDDTDFFSDDEIKSGEHTGISSPSKSQSHKQPPAHENVYEDWVELVKNKPDADNIKKEFASLCRTYMLADMLLNEYDDNANKQIDSVFNLFEKIPFTDYYIIE